MPKRDIRIGDVVLRRQPPVIGIWCMPPTTAKSERTDCGHRSPVCEGPTSTCEVCGFPFCASHFPRHRRRFECPIDIWRVFDERRKAWYERVKARPKSKPKVDVHFPDVEEAADG
jgi:hypothetical protein